QTPPPFPYTTLFRSRFGFGTLAELSMLDLRTYRSKQVAHPFDRDQHDPERTIAGEEQLRWLIDGLVTSSAQWKLIGNSVMIAPVRFPSTLSTRERDAVTASIGPTAGLPSNQDRRDGHRADGPPELPAR